jgi:hypothetical protein
MRGEGAFTDTVKMEFVRKKLHDKPFWVVFL